MALKLFYKRVLPILALSLILLLLFVVVVWKKSEPSPTLEPLEYRENLVRTLQKEKVAETIDKLADFDDVGWVMGSIPQGAGPKGSLEHNVVLIPRLNRVRKLLQLGQEDRETVIPLLEQRFDESAQGYAEAHAAFWKEHPDGGRWNPTKYDRICIEAPSTAYLLSELRSFSSLPRMLKASLRPDKILPVNRVFLWYAMHVLVCEHPREGLSKAALKALDAYKKQTTGLVANPRVIHVSAWKAKVEESDPRVVIGKQASKLKGQPTIELREYPYEIGDFYDPETWNLNDQGQSLFQQMKKFIDLAYPEGK
jgi:hypothetical protein